MQAGDGGGEGDEQTTTPQEGQNWSLESLLQDILRFFGLGGGGGGGASLPPNYHLFQRRLTYKRHQVYSDQNGILVLVSQGGFTPDPVTLTGGASYYNPSTTEPGKSACQAYGYPYTDPNGFTAAMRGMVGERGKFPCGTMASVTYGAKTILVKVIDSGPYHHPDRVIDLSPGAFKALAGSLKPGVISPVTVTIPAGPRPPLQ